MRKDLVERARRGDREAFGVLAAGEVDRRGRYARTLMPGSGAVGEDLVVGVLIPVTDPSHAFVYAVLPASNRRNPASSRIGTPSSWAFASLEPADSPATT